MEYYHNGNFTWLKIKARGVEKEHAREVCSVCLYRLWLQEAGNENQSGSYAWSELNGKATSRKKKQKDKIWDSVNQGFKFWGNFAENSRIPVS